MMAGMLNRIFAEEGAKGSGGPQGLMSLFGQGADLNWWRPLIIPFRPLVILFNLLLGARGGGGALTSSKPPSPRPVQTNEQMYEITWDESDRPVKVVVHRQVNEL